MSHLSSHICLPPFPNTDIPAYSDSAGTLKKCHCKRGASYCVTVSRHFYFMKVQGSEKCFCKRGASYCITESRVTVSGKPCMMYHLTHIECIPVSHKYVGYAARGRGAERGEGRPDCSLSDFNYSLSRPPLAPEFRGDRVQLTLPMMTDRVGEIALHSTAEAARRLRAPHMYQRKTVAM